MGDSLLVKNGKVVISGGLQLVNLLVEDGKISRISRRAILTAADEVIDARGLLVLPGVIDSHVHFREPGLTHKECFETGSMAAAAGGVTCVFEMPNTLPPVTNAKILEEKISLVKMKSFVDFGLYGLVTEESIAKLDEMACAGAIGFKMFMGPTTGNIPPPNDGAIIDALAAVAKTGLTLAIHAENDGIVQHFSDRLQKQGRKDPLAHCDARPTIAEEEAINRVILFSSIMGARINIVHMSTKEGVNLVKGARRRGLPVHGETCPQYLLMTSRDFEKLGTIAKINPPLRSTKDREAMWLGITGGWVELVGSDHAPHTVLEKTTSDIWHAGAGIIGVETLVPLMFTQVINGQLTLRRFTQITSENPARLFGLYPKKGAIEKLSDGDLTILNPKLRSTIKAEKLHSRNPITPFDGWTIKGVPAYTVVRGNIVMQEGEVISKPIGSAIKGTRFR